MDVGSAPASGTTSAKRSRSPSPSAAAKKVKTEAPAAAVAAAPASTETKPSSTSLLPPSTFIFGRQKQTDGSADTLRPPMETDVGILEYVRREGDAFHGIIKQRCVSLSIELDEQLSQGADHRITCDQVSTELLVLSGLPTFSSTR